MLFYPTRAAHNEKKLSADLRKKEKKKVSEENRNSV